MTQVIVDEALLREPNLWVPGKKPIGQVKIDSSHPIARGLTHFIYPSAPGTLTDLMKDSSLTKNGTLAYRRDARYGVNITNNNQQVNSGTVTNYIGLSNIASSPVSVLLVGVRYQTLTTNEIAIMTCTRSGGESAGFNLSLGNYYIDAGYICWEASGTNTGATLYVNGRKAVGVAPSDAPVVNDTVYACVGTYTTHAIGSGHTVLAKAAGISDFSNDVGVFAYAVWERQLTDAEGISLTLDPYQFLIPA